jgi:D-inositol-3-phosphate glycosyltransferase
MLPLKKPIILAVGLYSYGTGFTRVLQSLFAELSAHYTIHWLGIGYNGSTQQLAHYTLYANNVHGGDMYGAYAAATMALQLEIDFVFILNDLYMFKNYEEQLLPLKKKQIKLIGYIPLDGYINNAEIVKQIAFLDTIVCYAAWAKEEIEHAFSQLNHTAIPTLSVIYHGVDTAVFTPINKEKLIDVKRSIFPTIANAAEAVFILNANRNAERKDINTTLAAFALSLPHFIQPTYLCLHQPAITPLQKEQLINKIKQLNIQDYVILNPLGTEYVTSEQLSTLYQACAIGVNTSVGEGWGFISFEHGACGAAQIVPAHTTPIELWDGIGLCILKEQAIQLNSNPFLMYSVNVTDLSRQLISLVNDKNYFKKIMEQCYRFTIAEKFNWSFITLQWRKIFLPTAIVH